MKYSDPGYMIKVALSGGLIRRAAIKARKIYKGTSMNLINMETRLGGFLNKKLPVPSGMRESIGKLKALNGKASRRVVGFNAAAKGADDAEIVLSGGTPGFSVPRAFGSHRYKKYFNKGIT